MLRIVLIVLALLPSAPALAAPLSPGEWLLHLARDYPLSAGASATDADAQLTLLLMQAAARVDPSLAEPWYWQADMLSALGRPADARTALAEYIQRAPDDVPTRLRWIEQSTEALQTAEQRAAFWRRLLSNGDRLPREASSDLHRRLAEFHWNRGERDQAEAEARAAIADFKMNLAAGQLLDVILDQPLTPARQLEWALTEMVMDPANGEQALEIGHLLSSWGMATEADAWYNHADRLQELATGQQAAATRPSAASRPAPGTQSGPPEAQAMLDAFPVAVLDYPLNPTKYLSLIWRMDTARLAPGEPWRCHLQLKNTGTFPITFGFQRMVFPELLCSVTARGDQERTSGPVLRLSLNRRVRLNPGESIELTAGIDLGPIRAAHIATPQMEQQVEVVGILSPIRFEDADGREVWLPAIGGFAPPPLRFERSRITATPQRVQALIRQSESARAADRITATEVLSMLLAESQHLAAGRLRYSAARLEPGPVQTAILARTSDADWAVRARVAECLRWFVLDTAATQAAARMVGDRHWLVRGLTLRALTEHHREKLLPVLEQSARGDADEWVRQIARTLIDRMAAAATRPAEPTD